jgi:hypothetical protein
MPRHVEERYKARTKRLRALGYRNYGEYLRSPHWLRLRATYRASDLPQICVCGETEVHLHHLTYERVGAEVLPDLTPLCRRCHALVHVLEWRGQIGLDLDGLCDAERAAAGRAWLAAEIAAREREAAERLTAERAHVLSLSFAARLMRARAVAKARKIDVSHLVHIVAKCVEQGRNAEMLTRRLRAVESTAYGWEDW